MQDKLLKALTAKTPEGRANYLIDLVAEEGLHDPMLDSILHAVNEVGFGKGALDLRLQRWIRKTLKHKL
jgi:hypothetical protein